MMLRSLTAASAAALVMLTASACHRGEGLDASKLPENIRADYEALRAQVLEVPLARAPAHREHHR